MTLHNQQVGYAGQETAREYLLAENFNIIQENYRCKLGEIDLICSREKELIFVEVKTDLTGYFGPAEYRVGKKKQRRLKRAALYFLAQNKPHYRQDWQYRFDVITVKASLNYDYPPLEERTDKKIIDLQKIEINHYENAF